MDFTSLNQSININKVGELESIMCDEGSAKKSREFSDIWNHYIKKIWSRWHTKS